MIDQGLKSKFPDSHNPYSLEVAKERQTDVKKMFWNFAAAYDQ